MSIKFTTNLFKKLQDIIEKGGYKIRLEKGKFHSNQCVLEDKKLVVINQFLDIEGKVKAIMEMLPTLNLNKENVSKEELEYLSKLYRSINETDLFSQLNIIKPYE